jgi:hypothetical protein
MHQDAYVQTRVLDYEVEYALRNLSENDDAEMMNCVIQLPKLLLNDDGETADND